MGKVKGREGRERADPRPGLGKCKGGNPIKDKKLSYRPRDRAMHRVSRNLANCHATVQKLLVRQVLTKSTVRSWRFSWRQCVINMCTQP